MAEKVPNKAQLAETVKEESKAKIKAAKSRIEDNKKKIEKSKNDIVAAKNDIKIQKAAIKAAQAAAKSAKSEAKAESKAVKARAKADKAAKKADSIAGKAEKAEKKAGIDSSDDAKATPAPQGPDNNNAGGARESSGKYVIKKAADDSYVFNLCLRNGQIIATSQTYTTYDACRNGIVSVSVNAPTAPVEDQTVDGFSALPSPKFEVYLDKSGSAYRFRLKAKNGKNIVASQPYPEKSLCYDSIRSIRETSQTKIISDNF